MENQPGLKLESTRGSMKYLVIDSRRIEPDGKGTTGMNIRQAVISGTLVLASASSILSQIENPARFEVISIKRNTTSDPRIRQPAPQPAGRLVAVNAPVKLLIQNGYQMRPYQILGGPGWIDSEGYTLTPAPNQGRQETPERCSECCSLFWRIAPS
jgi:hypothetical protein